MQKQEFETIISEQLALFKSLKEEFVSKQSYNMALHLRGIEKHLIDITKMIEEKKNDNSPSSIKFQPWIGNNYKSESPKILVLGESHYNKADEIKETFTQNVIKSLALRMERRHKFFTIIAKILSDKADDCLSDDDSKEFWNKVSFYNYIQDFVGNTARIRPKQYMWEEARKPFQEVIEMLNPDIIIVSGKELGDFIKQDIETFENKIFCFWTHPSAYRYFNKQTSLEAFKLALKQFELKNNSIF